MSYLHADCCSSMARSNPIRYQKVCFDQKLLKFCYTKVHAFSFICNTQNKKKMKGINKKPFDTSAIPVCSHVVPAENENDVAPVRKRDRFHKPTKFYALTCFRNSSERLCKPHYTQFFSNGSLPARISHNKCLKSFFVFFFVERNEYQAILFTTPINYKLYLLEASWP